MGHHGVQPPTSVRRHASHGSNLGRRDVLLRSLGMITLRPMVKGADVMEGSTINTHPFSRMWSRMMGAVTANLRPLAMAFTQLGFPIWVGM